MLFILKNNSFLIDIHSETEKCTISLTSRMELHDNNSLQKFHDNYLVYIKNVLARNRIENLIYNLRVSFIKIHANFNGINSK